MKRSIFASALMASLATASPIAARTECLDTRDTTLCGQWDSLTTGNYTVYQNLWGKDTASPGGSQCTTVDGLSGNELVWSTNWTWSSPQISVKSYANAVVNAPAAQLTTIASIPSIWNWSYTGDELRANVAYDLFTGSKPNGSYEYEIMIWLDAFGDVGPLGSVIDTPTVGGDEWKLFQGTNSDTTVYSFVATSDQSNFKNDLNYFILYLTNHQGLSIDQYLVSIGAGSETFNGTKAELKTSAYSAVVNLLSEEWVSGSSS